MMELVGLEIAQAMETLGWSAYEGFVGLEIVHAKENLRVVGLHTSKP